MRDSIPRYDYHSAQKSPVAAPPLRHWTDGKSVALVHDLTAGPLPGEFNTCDVLYADLPWQTGYKTFLSRARAKPSTYADFMRALSDLIRAEHRPIYLVTGQHALKSLPDPAQVLPTRLNEYASVIVAYNSPPIRQSYGVSLELLRELAGQHERVGDFCCGYGSSARLFRRAGKTFVASDVNPECIGYIAEHVERWTTHA